MPQARLRVALDANVLIAGIRLPRWPHEVMRAAVRRRFDLVLPEQIVEEAQRHLSREQGAVLESFLSASACQLMPMPPADIVKENLGLVRSDKDVPIALALLADKVDISVTNDRDFTDPNATDERFSSQVRVMLPAVFLRDVMAWTSEDLEAIRNRTWEDISVDGGEEDADMETVG